MPNAPVQDGKGSWYPLPSEVDGVVEDDDGLLKSKASLSRELKEYLNNDKRLYIGGFSQGAALSLSLVLMMIYLVRVLLQFLVISPQLQN